MNLIQSEEDLKKSQRFLRECLLLIFEAVRAKEIELGHEQDPAVKDEIEADIDDLKAEIHVIKNRHDALNELSSGRRLTRPPDTTVNRVFELVEEVGSETDAARKAEIVLNVVDEVIMLAGEVRRLRAA